MSESTNYQPPSPSWGDRVHSLIRAGVSSVPVIGSAATELFSAVIAPPIERRRNEWMNEIAERLRQLDVEGRIKFEDLQENEAFITTVMQATQAAIRNHEKEKLSALQNAVINSALSQSLEASLQQLFVSWVDQFTVWHVRLLQLFADPEDWFRQNPVAGPNGSMSCSEHLINRAFPESIGRYDFVKVVVEDLQAKGLLSGMGSLRTMMTSSGVFAKRTTEIGDRFIGFISKS